MVRYAITSLKTGCQSGVMMKNNVVIMRDIRVKVGGNVLFENVVLTTLIPA